MKPIPVANPLMEYTAHKEEITSAIQSVLDRGRYILGDEVVAFENEFCAYVGSKFGTGVGNGTDALHIALKAIGVGAGDEVITVSHTAVATVSAIVMSGATPVFVDIDLSTFNLDVRKIEENISSKTRAIIVVHLYGNPARIDEIVSLAKKHNVKVIEDCSQAHGATVGGRHVGTFGEAGTFSFYPTKNLGAIGDGGMVVTNDPSIHEANKLLREYGWKERYVSSCHGWNSRLDEVQAAILRIKLRYLGQSISRRQEIGSTYLHQITNPHLILPVVTSTGEHAYHLFVLRSSNREELRTFLKSRNIDSLIHYPVPVHKQPGYSMYALGTDLKETVTASEEVLSIPLFPGLQDPEVEHIISALNEF